MAVLSTNERLHNAVQFQPNQAIASASCCCTCTLWDRVCCLKEKPSYCLPVCFAVNEVFKGICGRSASHNNDIYLDGHNRAVVRSRGGNICSLFKECLCAPIKDGVNIVAAVSDCCKRVFTPIAICECDRSNEHTNDCSSCASLTCCCTTVSLIAYEAIQLTAGPNNSIDDCTRYQCHDIAQVIGTTHAAGLVAACSICVCCMNGYLQFKFIKKAEAEPYRNTMDTSQPSVYSPLGDHPAAPIASRNGYQTPLPTAAPTRESMTGSRHYTIKGVGNSQTILDARDLSPAGSDVDLKLEDVYFSENE